MNLRNMVIGTLAALYMASGCASNGNPKPVVTIDQTARLLNSDIQNYLRNSSNVQVYIVVEQLSEGKKEIYESESYNGPIISMPRLEEILLSEGIFRQTSSRDSATPLVGIEFLNREMIESITLKYKPDASSEQKEVILTKNELDELAHELVYRTLR